MDRCLIPPSIGGIGIAFGISQGEWEHPAGIAEKKISEQIAT